LLAREQELAFVYAIVARFPGLRPMLDEHLTDNFGDILPHLFFGDVTRYVLSLLREARASDVPSRRRELREILDYLEETYSSEEALQEIISVSFLEHLPRPSEEGWGIREMVGPSLRRQLQVIG
jgi:hypothetical protein